MSSSEDEYDPSGALDDLDSSIDDLERILKPLLDGTKTWDEMVGDEGDELMKAKLSMMMAYGICDLLFVYLQMKGHDPSEHPVMVELKRIMEYNGKIKEAESQPKARTKIDVAAAGRFINAAIPKSQRAGTPGTPGNSSRAGTPMNGETEGQVGMINRFRHFGEGEVVDLSRDGE